MRQRRELIARRIATWIFASDAGGEGEGEGGKGNEWEWGGGGGEDEEAPQEGLPVCALSGGVAFDAAKVCDAQAVTVTLPERRGSRSIDLEVGTVVSKRYGLAYGVRTEPCIYSAEVAAEALRSTIVEGESYEASALRSCPTDWTRLMPADGVRGYTRVDDFAEQLADWW